MFRLPPEVAKFFQFQQPWQPAGPNSEAFYRKQLEEIATQSGGTFTRFYPEDETAPDRQPMLAVTGTVTAQDPLHTRRVTRYKSHTVELRAGLTYQIDMVATTFEPYLYLSDPKGVLIAESSPTKLAKKDSLITFRAASTGTYRITATTRNGGATGSYALTVIDELLK
jgi:hypothetical protein